MGFYEVLKVVHLGAIIVWVGGGLGLLVLFAAAERSRDDADALRVIKGASILGPTLSVPAGLLVLLSGLGMVWADGLAWEAWVLLSLLGVAAVFGLGAGVVGPKLEWATLIWERDGDEAKALACGRRALRIARLDQVLQFAILALNVIQPAWTDVGIIAGLGILVTIGVLLTLRPGPGLAEPA